MKLLYQSDGVMLFEAFRTEDGRGSFTKIYRMNELCGEYGIQSQIREVYYSVSGKDVIRGMHFQSPPHEHDKFVHIISGAAEDIVVDLRESGPNYGKCHRFELTAKIPQFLYIPRGFAHGFRALADNTCMMYMVSSEYHKASDSGIHYRSIRHDWKVKNPIVSERDQAFQGIDEFQSPF